ncbi:MAG: NifB/NifX family molybdenum-iron cluster-binding protein [Clostridia bacterium]|nr:NifB/NifX family molybdenum-iron cluster-binding protein [Clostridia bacterium]MDD4048219.1 NifB/NifX family molybdenum-iron cluster-binding protein [Clostridia bacterium]
MKIAMPVVKEQLCMHFGHCEVFAFFEVDEKEKKILNKEFITPPNHEPGILPPWIKEQGADLVITGGMGARAQNLFLSQGIKVITGAPVGNPENVVLSYLNNNLEIGQNVCDH